MGYTLSNIKRSPFKGLKSSWVSSDYGNRKFWNNVTGKYVEDFHSGIDLTSGTEITATAKGKVTACRNNVKGYNESLASGNYVTLYHGDNVYSTYCHMEYGSIKVKVGDIVDAGTVIGIKGSTGFSTGPHLHYGVKVNGSWIDPKPYLLGTKEFPQYGGTNPIPSGNLKYKQGDEVIFTGTLYRDSYGNGAGQKRNNLRAKIYLVNKNGSHPYNINNGLGWVKETDLTPINTTPGNYYTVVRGDTLWGIAKKFYGNGSKYPDIAKANNISNPDLIHAGQKLLIP